MVRGPSAPKQDEELHAVTSKLEAARIDAPTVPAATVRVSSAADISAMIFELDEWRKRKSLVELHTHLLGMGDHTFWIKQMREVKKAAHAGSFPDTWKLKDMVPHFQHVEMFRPAGYNSKNSALTHFWAAVKKASEEKTDLPEPLTFDTKSLAAAQDLRLSPAQVCGVFATLFRSARESKKGYPSIPFVALAHTRQLTCSEGDSSLPITKKLYDFCNQTPLGDISFTMAKMWSSDVIYTQERLEQALHTLGVRKQYEEEAALHSRLDPRHTGKFNAAFKQYVVWDARTQAFDLVTGLPNTVLLQLMDSSAVVMHNIQNAFSILECNGQEVTPETLNALIMDQFTPEFYPRRFSLKDALYEQRLDTLNELLKHVLERYSTA